MNTFLKKLEHSADVWFLLMTSFFFFLFRLPSFFEPYWYGDEGVYEVVGYAMRHRRMLYQGIWDNKPPLLYLIYALFDGNQPYVKFFSFLVGLTALYFFFALSKLLFHNRKAVFFATGFFALFLGLPLVEGNIANAENFMVLPAVAAAYLVVKTVKEEKYSLLPIFSAGLLLGISFLIKVVAVFDYATLFLFIGFLLFSWNKKTIQNIVGKLLTLSVGFFLPILITVLFFLSKGLLGTFIQSAFLSNVGYVNYGNQFVLPFTKIIVPQGFLLIRLILLAVITIFLFIKRKQLSLPQLLTFLWVPFSLFSALFSGRPYTHYMLVLLGSISLLIGLVFTKKTRIVAFVIFIAVCIFLGKTFSFYNKTVGYYENFIGYITNTNTTSHYQSFFDAGVPRDYDVAEYINQNVKSNQQVFLWTNSAQIYYLIHRLPLTRYTVAYHMTTNNATLSETGYALETQKPRFIVILPNAPVFPFIMSDYVLKISLHHALIYERVL